MSEEGDRWFRIEQDRKRALRKIEARAKKRLLNEKHRDLRKHRAAIPTEMTASEWFVDEFGNLSRIIIGR
jgi:hypothetical protein